MDTPYDDLLDYLTDFEYVPNQYSDVDLTKNNILSTSKNKSASIISNLSKPCVSKFSQRGLVYTGDMKDVETKRFCNTFSDGVHCDCCGAKIYPWEHDCLCESCRQSFDIKEHQKFAFSRHEEQ